MGNVGGIDQCCARSAFGWKRVATPITMAPSSRRPMAFDRVTALGMAIAGRPSTGSGPTEVVLEALDVVLAEVVAVLHLDEHEVV
jgi:hypothetical protein